jgi:hypothetical protein
LAGHGIGNDTASDGTEQMGKIQEFRQPISVSVVADFGPVALAS